MCGIAGWQGSFAPDALRRMSSAIAHRGPDDAGTWECHATETALAHRRLAIIDPTAQGHQPMLDAGTANVVVFNGEIYNYRSLRDELARQGSVCRTQSDTEVLLALYRFEGEAMLRRLNGIFAFAIYDGTDGSVFLACDEFAVKPLYFHQHSQGFIFASELKALLASRLLEPIPDPAVLMRTVAFLWSPGGVTPLRGVQRLGPGESLRVKNGRIVKRGVWAESAWTTSKSAGTVSDAASSVSNALRTAVRRQLVSDVPVGAFLSGGLDSTAVVGMAREAAPHIECFTIDTGGERDHGFVDDLPYAQHAAAHLGVKLNVVRVAGSRMAAGLEQMIAQLDEPLADPAPMNVLFISQLAREAGVKVLLSGAGGDDLFSGYRRHRALVAERYWSRLPHRLRRGVRHLSAGVGQKHAFGRRLSKMFMAADAQPAERLTSYFLWRPEAEVRALFADEHRAGLDSEAMAAPMEGYLASLPSDLSPLDRMLALEQRFFLTDHNLLYTDKMGMAAGVEIRVPFLDRDLVRLANSLPPAFKQRGRQGKWILKKAMEPLLPREIIYRPKTGFGAPVRRWLRNEWRELVEDTLSSTALRRRGLFDAAAVSRLIADDRAGRVDGAYTILALVCIEIWCRHFLGARAPACSAMAAGS